MKALRGMILISLVSTAFAAPDTMSGAPAGTAAADAAGTYKLRVSLAEGTKWSYKLKTVVEGTMDMSAFGAQEMPITLKSGMDVIMTMGKVDSGKGVADLAAKMSNLVLDMEPAPPNGMDLPKEFTFTAKINDKYTLSDVKVAGLDGQAKSMMGTSIEMITRSFSFPDQELKIGDTWQLPKTRKSEFGESTQDVTATLAGVEKMMGADVFKVTMKGSGVSTSESEGPQGKMKMKVESKVDSVVYIDKATGKLLKSSSQGPATITIELGEGMKIPMKTTYVSTIELSDKKMEGEKMETKEAKEGGN